MSWSDAKKKDGAHLPPGQTLCRDLSVPFCPSSVLVVSRTRFPQLQRFLSKGVEPFFNRLIRKRRVLLSSDFHVFRATYCSLACPFRFDVVKGTPLCVLVFVTSTRKVAHLCTFTPGSFQDSSVIIGRRGLLVSSSLALKATSNIWIF